MAIEGGELDNFSGNSELEITFWQNEKERVRKLEPGKSYAFRYDENYQLNIFEVPREWYPPVDLAPDVSTPMIVVEKMLEMAEVDSSDVVYDLGSGDGRIVITAAKKYGARGVGIDIDERRILESRANAKKAGVENLVEFRLQDITEADFSEATVVTLYLLTSSNVLMLPFLESQIKPGSYVVSHNYKILGWEEKEVNLVMITGEDGVRHSIYLYRR
jgi:2-polyprenyl-3-methyl-5-hydroxy-6-metoxy-1,4-benzoquinol methylase